MALLFLGVIGLILTHCPIPQVNHDYIIYILGALSGAITVGGPRAVNALTTNGPNTTVTAPDKPQA